jgi:predicted DNA-binding protein (MmcQ/YjbR family)
MAERTIASREEVFACVREQYGVEAEYPWMRTPRSAIMRHKHNRKWFAAIVDITEDKLGINGKEPIDALLLKCDPMLKGILIDNQSIFPAYHMNKEHWITVRLDAKSDKTEGLINLSYDLTKGKK